LRLVHGSYRAQADGDDGVPVVGWRECSVFFRRTLNYRDPAGELVPHDVLLLKPSRTATSVAPRTELFPTYISRDRLQFVSRSGRANLRMLSASRVGIAVESARLGSVWLPRFLAIGPVRSAWSAVLFVPETRCKSLEECSLPTFAEEEYSRSAWALSHVSRKLQPAGLPVVKHDPYLLPVWSPCST